MNCEEPSSTPQLSTSSTSYIDNLETSLPPPNVPPPENYQIPARPFWWPIPTRVKAVPIPEDCHSLKSMELFGIPPPNVPKPENYQRPAVSTLPIRIRGPIDAKRRKELRKELIYIYCKKVWDDFYYTRYKTEALRDLEMLRDIIIDNIFNSSPPHFANEGLHDKLNKSL